MRGFFGYQKTPSRRVTTHQERIDEISRGALRHQDRNLFSRAYHAIPQMLGRSTYTNLRENMRSEVITAKHKAAQSPAVEKLRKDAGRATFEQNQARRMAGKARDYVQTAGGEAAKRAQSAEQVSKLLSAPEYAAEAAEAVELATTVGTGGMAAPITLPALLVSEGVRQGANAGRAVFDGAAVGLHDVARRRAESAAASTDPRRPEKKRFYQHSADMHGANSEINETKVAKRVVNAALPAGLGLIGELAAGAAESVADRAEDSAKQRRGDAITGRATAFAEIHQKDTEAFQKSVRNLFKTKKIDGLVGPLRDHAAEIGRKNLAEKRSLGELAYGFGVASGPKTSGALKREGTTKQRSLHTQLTDHLARAATGKTREERDASEAAALHSAQQWLEKRNTGFGRVKRLFEGRRYGATKDLVSRLSSRREARRD